MSDDPDWYAFDPREWLDFENVTLNYLEGEDLVRELEWIDESDWDIDEVVEQENALQMWAICLICGNSLTQCVC